MKKTCILIAYMICFLMLNIKEEEASLEDYETVEVSLEERNQIVNNINLQKLAGNKFIDSFNMPLYSFDVSEDGKIILTIGGGNIAILDGKRIVGFYEVNHANGRQIPYFQVRWKEEHIVIIDLPYLMEFTQDGQVIDVVEIKDGINIYNRMLRKEVKIDGIIYRMQNKMGPLNFTCKTYSQLVKIDQNGQETMIYDINTYLLVRKIMVAIFGIVFSYGCFRLSWKNEYRRYL